MSNAADATNAPVPDALQQAIEAAHHALRLNVEGHLPRRARHDVFDALGTPDLADPASYRRTLASAALVERALPFWAAERPDDDTPAQLLKAALASRPDAVAAWSRAEAFDEEVLELYPGISNECGAAAHAAVQLVYEAARGLERNDLPGDPPDLDDHDFDPWGWDAAYYAEMAITSDDPARNREGRHALWVWWLDEVVPVVAARPV